MDRLRLYWSLLTFVGLISLSQPLFAQHRSGSIIMGRVLDAKTNEPLENANVFLSTTLIGTSSGKDGLFRISGVPVGTYDLAVSQVGFDLYTIRVQCIRQDSIYYEIRLQPHALQYHEVEVTGQDPKEWKKSLQIFIKAFIGKGRFSDQCEILNPQVIEFRFDKTSDSLVASSDSIIHVANSALGYYLHIALDQFQWNVGADMGHYLVYLFFEEMKPGSTEEVSVWNENRNKAFEGSLKQFLLGLYAGQIPRDLFTIYTGPKVELLEGPSHRVEAEDFESEKMEGVPLKRISFPEYLRVEGGKRERVFTKREWVEYRSEVSLLCAKNSQIVVDSLGNLFDPLALEVSGTWAQNRVSELLPKASTVPSSDSVQVKGKFR